MENVDGKLTFSINSYQAVPKLIELKTHSSVWEFNGVIIECSEFSFKSMKLTLIVDKIYSKSNAVISDFDIMFSTPLTEEEKKAWKEMDKYNPMNLASILNLQEYSSIRKITHQDLYKLNGFKQVFEWLKTIDDTDRSVLYHISKNNDYKFFEKLNEYPHLASVSRFQYELIKRYLHGKHFETIEYSTPAQG